MLELFMGLRDKYEIFLASGEDGFLLEYASKNGIESFLLPSLKRKISPVRDFMAYREIRNLIQRIKPDLVHTHSSKAGILGRLAAHRLGVKNIFTAHGWAFAEGTSRSRKLISIPPEIIAAKWCNRIITVSAADRELAIQQHISKAEKFITIHNGISDISEQLIARPDNETPVLAMVARIAPPKNFLVLLNALALISSKFILRIVGDGPELNQVRDHAKNIGINEKVEFMGSRDDVPEILSSSDIFILSSDWEGFPISILEGMRAGLPIIASNVGGISEAVIEGVNGHLVERKDTHALSRAIRLLIEDPEKRVKMGQRSRQLFLEIGTTETMLEATDKVYQSLI